MVMTPIVMWDDPYSSPPPKKKILFAVRDLNVAAKLRADLADANLTTISPDFDCYEKDFDVIVMCFEPMSSTHQTWFHTKVKPLLAPNGAIYWS